ncbi:TIGR01621 family pseudouridine synthase [Paraferrimonas sedimenticola]|uniref:RNA pseudouridine synthase n=1 Tax=Paraferrimonas sedimenticola TaxID=375674 RepID=A0AA37W0G9_9GAMM|nr:TIGR01621 family pseudouridine synthase [Paraferrimonas sedimenticola]GLP95398.1 RNA pseudouridine synthase [Paraferrimonas sedimenticola]
MALEVLLEHQDWLVINKPAGVHFHSQDGNAGVIAQLQVQLGYPLFAVHRLDTMTSGVLLVAKSSASAAALSAQFANRTTEKRYIALAQGKPKKKQGLIKGDMQKARRSQWKLCKTLENPAITQFFSHSLGEGLRLYLLRPKTGKTHQLRVALKSLGCPILGDVLYGGERSGGETSERGYLHAWRLGFEWLEEKIWVEAPTEQGLFANAELQAQLTAWRMQEPAWPAL